MSDFAMSVRDGGQAVEVVVKGTIDETTELTAPESGGRPVAIDCGGVTRINSVGVGLWLRWVGALSARVPVVFRRVPAVLVTQAAMIEGFFGRGQVESFATPWVCPACDASHEQMHGGRDPVPETLPCPACGAAMDLDWDRESYLAFRKP